MNKFLIFIALSAAFLLLADLIAIGVKLRRAGQIKTSADMSAVDIAFAFYGGSGPATHARVDAAIGQYHAGHVKVLGFVGGCRPAKGQYGSRDMAARAIAGGVPKDKILIGEGSYDSKTNIQRVQTLYLAGGYKSAAFISDPLHLPRLSALAAPMSPALWPADYGGGRMAPIWRAQYEIIVDLLSFAMGEARYQSFVKSHRLDVSATPDKGLCSVPSQISRPHD